MSRIHARLNAVHWAAVRRYVFARDGYRCLEYSRAGRPECDHITPLEREPPLAPAPAQPKQNAGSRGLRFESLPRNTRARFCAAQGAFYIGRGAQGERPAPKRARDLAISTGSI